MPRGKKVIDSMITKDSKVKEDKKTNNKRK
jgi:hypothetical protein